jgi:hypothetical protein
MSVMGDSGKLLSPISRRVFLTATSLGIAAGASLHSQASAQEKQTAKALVELSSLVWWNLEKYKVDRQLLAAIELQALGKDLACDVLSSFAKKLLGDERGYLHREESLIALTRILFVARPGAEFRRARMGGPDFLGETDLDDWPLEPIEIVDGVPFSVARGYMLFGEAESAYKYISYCLENCDWNPYQFELKSNAQKQDALSKLLASPKWKQKLTPSEKVYLSNQIL